MFIMSKNKVLCEYDFKSGKAVINGKLPYGLYLEEGDEFDVRINNHTNFEHWCASRVLSLDREYAKEILNSCALTQSATDKDRAEIALKYNCLSLQDFFWIRKGNEQWEEINLFKNSLSHAVIDIALRGRPLTVTNAMLIAPDCSTAGVMPKAWVRKEDGFYLYKGDASGSVCKEVEASKILQRLGISVLEYEYEEWEGERVASCKCFTSENVGFVSAEAYLEDYSFGTVISEDYYFMNLADFLIGNTDRHWGNWGFLFNEEGIQGYAPLMDFNHSFEAELSTPCLPEIIRGKQCTQLEAALDALQHVNIEFADLSDFKYGPYVAERIKLLEDKLNREFHPSIQGTSR